MGYLTYRTGGPLRSPNPTMNTNIAHMFRSPASSLRIAGGLGLLSMAGISAPTLSASPLLAEVSVNIVLDPAPPPPRHEIVVERDRPGPDYLWIDGYWDGSPAAMSGLPVAGTVRPIPTAPGSPLTGTGTMTGTIT